MIINGTVIFSCLIALLYVPLPIRTSRFPLPSAAADLAILDEREREREIAAVALPNNSQVKLFALEG